MNLLKGHSVRTIISQRVRLEVFDRAGGLCECILPNGKRCCRPGSEIHHLVARKMGGRRGQAKKNIENIDNYRLFCLECHRYFHG